MRNQAIGILIILFLIFVSGKSLKLYFDEHANYKRMEQNLKISQDSCKYFKGKDGASAVKLQSQTLTIKELREVLPGVIAAAKNLYIRPALLQNYTKAGSETNTEIKAAIHDAIKIKGTDTIRIGSINYRSPFYSIKGTIEADTAYLKTQSRDTIQYFSSRGRRVHPWAWILSKRKSDEVTISNKNPDCKITILQSIKIKR